MLTLTLEVLEVNPVAVADLDVADDAWAWSEDRIAAMAEEAALDDAWDRACEVGYLPA